MALSVMACLLAFEMRLTSAGVLFPCMQGVSLEEVSKVLRSRFGTSGIEEKAARPAKQA
jgi:hypothetical protein